MADSGPLPTHLFPAHRRQVSGPKPAARPRPSILRKAASGPPDYRSLDFQGGRKKPWITPHGQNPIREQGEPPSSARQAGRASATLTADFVRVTLPSRNPD